MSHLKVASLIMFPKGIYHVDVSRIYIIPNTERSWFVVGAAEFRFPKKTGAISSCTARL